MKVIDRLHKQLQNFESRRASARLIWSGKFSDHCKYVFFRSRGYLYRISSNAISEIAASVALLMISGPGATRWSIGLFAVNFSIGTILDGFARAIRGAKIDQKGISNRPLIAGFVFVWACAYGYIFLHFDRLLGRHALLPMTAVLLLTAMRAATSFVELWVSAITVNHISVKRVFVHPLSSYISAALSVLYSAVGVACSGMAGLLVVVIGMTVVRAGRDFYFLWCVLRSEPPEEPELQDSAEGISYFEDFKRFMVHTSHAFFPAFLISTQIGTSMLLQIWFLNSICERVLQRPFQAASIDVLTALRSGQWRRVVPTVSDITRLSGLAAIVSIVVTTLGMRHFGLDIPPLFLGWVVLTSMNRLIVLSLGSVGLELELAPWLLVGRVLTVLLCVSHAKWSHLDAAFTISLAVEFAILAASVKYVLSLELGKRIEFRHVTNAFKAGMADLWPSTFFTTYRTVLPALERCGIGHRLYRLGLNPRIPKSSLPRLIGRIRSRLRSNDISFPLNSRALLICAIGGAESGDSGVRARFLENFPYEVDFVEPVSLIDALSIPFHADTPVQPLAWSELQNEEMLLHYLSNLKEKSFHSISGSWWVPFEDGSWRSLEGRASLERCCIYAAQTGLQKNIILQLSSQIRRVSSGVENEEDHYFLAPNGKIMAVFSTCDDPMDVRPMLELAREGVVRSLITRESSRSLPSSAPVVPTVSPEEIVILEQVFKHCLSYWDFSVRIERLSGEEAGAAAVSTDGLSRKLALVIAQSPKTRSVEKIAFNEEKEAKNAA